MVNTQNNLTRQCGVHICGEAMRLALVESTGDGKRTLLLDAVEFPSSPPRPKTYTPPLKPWRSVTV